MGTRDVTEAHFLHQRQGLEAVLRPPVTSPTALCWLPGREELLAGTRDGHLYHVDPVLGTRLVASELGEPAVVAVHPDRRRYLVLARDGTFAMGRLGVGVEHRGKHPFIAGMDGLWVGEFAVGVGDGLDGHRQLLVWGEGVEKGRQPMPARAIALRGAADKLLLARCTEAGLEVVRFSTKGARWSASESTAHRLKACGPWVLGLTPTGAAVWGRDGGSPRSVRLPDLTAGDVNIDGASLGMGTKTGAVALARVDRPDARAKPHLVKAFENPVICASFSDRGRWLATGAEALQLWTWED